MHNPNKTIKKVISSFLGVASISAFISLPGIAQASNQLVTAQNVPTTGSPTNTRQSLTALDREFMTKAAQSDLTEIQTSQLALQRSRNKQVRAFAQHMIEQHTNSSNQLKQIARQKGVTLPRDIGRENRALLTNLRKQYGQNFDRAYMERQVRAHSKTLAEYQRYLGQGQDPQLRGFANKISPLVAEHLQMSQRMVARR